MAELMDGGPAHQNAPEAKYERFLGISIKSSAPISTTSHDANFSSCAPVVIQTDWITIETHQALSKSIRQSSGRAFQGIESAQVERELEPDRQDVFCNASWAATGTTDHLDASWDHGSAAGS
jgi:hypothetical protein